MEIFETFSTFGANIISSKLTPLRPVFVCFRALREINVTKYRKYLENLGALY